MLYIEGHRETWVNTEWSEAFKKKGGADGEDKDAEEKLKKQQKKKNKAGTREGGRVTK